MRTRSTLDIGAIIRDTRRRRGMTQRDLASKVGVTQAWLSQVENGKSSAEIGLVLRALATLGIDIDMHDPKSGAPTPDRSREPTPLPDFPDVDAIVERHRKP